MKRILFVFALLFFSGGKTSFNPEADIVIFSPTRIDYPVGNNPWSVTSGDFNNDGKQDIVTANKESNNVTLLTGKGDGTFNPATGFSVGSDPLVVITEYFNEDSYPDLGTSNFGSDNISVLLGNGDGTFQDAMNFNSGITTRCLTSADLNGDGYADIAVSNRDNYSVSILLGKGDGSFNNATVFSTGQIKPRLLVTGKFNSDTTTDLAFTHAEAVEERGDIIGILPGNGDGTFGNVVIANVDVIGHFQDASSIAGEDFNKDGVPDLAVGVDVTGSEETDYISIMLNNGNGSFSNAAPLQLGWDGDKPFYISAAYLNGDSNPDLIATGSGPGYIAIYLGNGDGTFISEGYYKTAQYPRWITINDFNGDSNPDVVTANEGTTIGGTVSILPGNGDGSFNVSPAVAVDTTQAYAGTAEDFDNNGTIDLAIANWGLSNVTPGVLSILYGDGDGTFTLSGSYTIGKAAKSVVAEKFNNDEYPDLAIVQDRSHNVAVFINKGDGTFQAAVDYPVDLNPLSLASGDFNQDDIPDLATANYNGNNFSVLLGNGDGTFGIKTDFSTIHGSRDIIASDINNDQFTDMIILCNEISLNINLIAVHFGNGDGSFSSANTFDIPGVFAWDMTSGDFNGDNKPDLVVLDYDLHEIYLYTGNGNGTFSSETLLGYIHKPVSTVPGDFNNDNFEDISVASATNDNVTLFLGNGDGTFIKQTHSYGSEEAFNQIAADIDSDQDQDLVVTTGMGNNHVTVLENTTIINVETKEPVYVPDNFVLKQNYPNPFNPGTTIKFTIPGLLYTTLKVYDILGNEIAVLVNEEKPAGTFEVSFNSGNLSSGIYFYRLDAGNFNATRKMILLK